MHVHQYDVVSLTPQRVEDLDSVTRNIGAVTEALNHLDGNLLVDGIVLSHQNADRQIAVIQRGGDGVIRPVGPADAEQRIKHGIEGGCLDRFVQPARGNHPVRLLFTPRSQRLQQDNGQTFRPVLERAGEPVILHKVWSRRYHNRIKALLLHALAGQLGRLRAFNLDAALGGDAGQVLPSDLALADQQQTASGEVRYARLAAPVLVADGHRKEEGRSVARFAFHPESATHPFRQTLADGEAEAGSAVLARNRTVSLHEGLEEPVNLLGRDADTRVAHRNAQV